MLSYRSYTETTLQSKSSSQIVGYSSIVLVYIFVIIVIITVHTIFVVPLYYRYIFNMKLMPSVFAISHKKKKKKIDLYDGKFARRQSSSSEVEHALICNDGRSHS